MVKPIVVAALASALALSCAADAPLHPTTTAAGHDRGALASASLYSVTLTVPDIERAAAWYVQKLGFHEVSRAEYPQFGTRLRFLELNGRRVELIEDRTAHATDLRPDPPKHTAWYGISQFCLETLDVESVKAELRAAGVPITWEFENAALGVHFIFIRDLDGNLIQYLQTEALLLPASRRAGARGLAEQRSEHGHGQLGVVAGDPF